MRFLVVEDDPMIADHIINGLSGEGHCAVLAETGAKAVRAIEGGTFDAAVLDRLLPDISGLAVIQHVRDLGDPLPMLMLSALGSVEDRIEGLRAGADDYLAKPFVIEELIARLYAIARRNVPRGEGAMIEVGALRLDPSSHRAHLYDRSVPLNRKQYSMLAHLMRNADRVVTRSMLLEAVWAYSFSPATNIVESNMSRLRSTLLALGSELIETQRGVGYVLRTERCL